MREILQIAIYELIHVVKDKVLFALIFLGPVAYAVLFCLVYGAALINEVPLGIVNLDGSTLSREVATAFSNTHHFQVIEEIESFQQLEEGMRNGTVRAGVVIPEEFSQRVVEHRLTEVKVVYDASNLLWGYNTRKYALEVINQFSVHYAAGYLAGLGYTQAEIAKILDSIACTSEIWYNPTFNYNNFLFMGIIIIIIHQLGLLSSALTITREKERNCWLQYLCSPISRTKIFLGKSLLYFIVNFFNYSLLLWLTAEFLQLKIEGSIALLICLGLLISLIITGLGFCVSVLAPNSLQATRYLMLLSVPLFMLSGFTWPKSHMPALLNGLADLIPFTWMVNSFRQLNLKNLGWVDLGPALLVLGVMAVGSIGAGWWLAKQPYRRKPYPIPTKSKW